MATYNARSAGHAGVVGGQSWAAAGIFGRRKSIGRKIVEYRNIRGVRGATGSIARHKNQHRETRKWHQERSRRSQKPKQSLWEQQEVEAEGRQKESCNCPQLSLALPPRNMLRQNRQEEAVLRSLAQISIRSRLMAMSLAMEGLIWTM